MLNSMHFNHILMVHVQIWQEYLPHTFCYYLTLGVTALEIQTLKKWAIFLRHSGLPRQYVSIYSCVMKTNPKQ